MIALLSRSLRAALPTRSLSGPFGVEANLVRMVHRSSPVLGFEEFFDDKKNPNDVILAGRSWTVSDLRRKVNSFHLYFYR